MAANVHLREQRLRKQAELKSLYTNLANLREREASYMEASAALPEFLLHQINETRREIGVTENELITLNDETIQTPARQFYGEALQSELAGDFDKALKLYKSAERHEHPDANAAIRSLRYQTKLAKTKAAAGKVWTPPTTVSASRRRLWFGLAVILILLLIAAFMLGSGMLWQPPEIILEGPTATMTLPAVILIIPPTATSTPTATPTLIPTPTPPATPRPTNPPVFTPTPLPPTNTPSPTPTLRPAPKMIGPKNGLVWLAGAIVFEFEKLDLAYDELYCLNTLRGYDQNNTENWSFPPTSSKRPSIPIEENVINVAKALDMRCIVWSASIGKGSCDNIISQSTEERVIGLPNPCYFNK
jgi:hypothetical protein